MWYGSLPRLLLQPTDGVLEYTGDLDVRKRPLPRVSFQPSTTLLLARTDCFAPESCQGVRSRPQAARQERRARVRCWDQEGQATLLNPQSVQSQSEAALDSRDTLWGRGTGVPSVLVWACWSGCVGVDAGCNIQATRECLW